MPHKLLLSSPYVHAMQKASIGGGLNLQSLDLYGETERPIHTFREIAQKCGSIGIRA